MRRLEKIQSVGEFARLLGERARGHGRLIAAIAGAPGSGKSTIAEALLATLNTNEREVAALVPMDGYHYDNAVLKARGLFARKGAPETFNAEGIAADLARIRAGHEVAVPMFDRAADLARANAAIVAASTRVVVVEGNYLLVDRPPWQALADLFNVTVMVETDRDELERRLIRRWRDYGLDEKAAIARARGNDLINADYVLANSRSADFVLAN
jgi:pantothenate kinase